MTAWLLLVLALLLVAACGIFVAAEFSFVTVDRASVDRRADAGDAAAQGLRQGLTTLSTQLSGAQLGITVTSLVIGFIAEPSIATLLRDPLATLGWSESTVNAVAVALALIIATVLSMVLGELVPKNWAISEPVRVGRAVQGPMRAFTRVTSPIITLLNGSANRVLGWFGIEAKEELASARSPEELASLVERSAEQGTLDEDTADLVTRSIIFSRLTAEDVMTARPRVIFAGADQTAAEL
ncbi:MAG: CNNM domain-containing protein, partial [Candidatus Nanopelagicales bacterium]